MPAYIKEFNCTAADCDFNCCGGWIIAIDRSSFDLINRKIKNHGGCEDILTCNRSTLLPDLYGRLNLRSRMCPLLGEDRLCTVQKEYGESFLPKACATFPKIANKIGRLLQVSARLSCPAVAKLVFSDDSGLQISQEKLDFRNFLSKNRLELANVNWRANSKNRFVENFEDVQKFVIEILSNRKLSIEDRLEVLFEFIHGLVELDNRSFFRNKRKANENLAELIKKVETRFEIGVETDEKLKDINYQHEFLAANILSEHVKAIKEFEREMFGTKILELLVKAEELDSQAYESGLQKLYSNYREQTAEIFEKFLINWTLNEMFPFKSDSLFYETVRIAINFVIIRYLLVVKVIESESLTQDDAVEIICLYSRAFGNTELPRLKQSSRTNTNEVFDLLKILLRF